jgi:phosphoglycolate phosphatase-like HAD superfamily hydrolase
LTLDGKEESKNMKLLLFDLDGTLVSTGGAGLRALDRAFHSLHGIARAMQGISPAGKTDPSIIREVFQTKLQRSPEKGEVRAVCESYLNCLSEEMARRNGYRVMKGVAALLENLARRSDVILALGTGNLEPGARIKLAPSGLNDYFPFGGFGSDAEERAEVLRAGVRRARERTGRSFAGEDVLVIGDTILDVRAGKAIGAFTVAVACGHGKSGELQAAGPDVFMRSFEETEALLRELDS